MYSLQKRTRLLVGLIGISVCISCETPVIPITGTYVGETVTETWGFEEVLDNDGNMVGIKAVRDTSFSQQESLTISQVNKSENFSLSATGDLARINAFASREFSYKDPQSFSRIESTDGTETKRLEFSIDGTGNLTLTYIENDITASNRPPAGRMISFSGVAE